MILFALIKCLLLEPENAAIWLKIITLKGDCQFFIVKSKHHAK
ncbi:hypothetical protein A45J_1561 [hot springs metagenome]|uniref:Uncharacterized protein n=1 Tax=hot springs metagenome TaxID=433727 RepID=A0A5J4L0P8_9ZZZZ